MFSLAGEEVCGIVLRLSIDVSKVGWVINMLAVLVKAQSGFLQYLISAPKRLPNQWNEHLIPKWSDKLFPYGECLDLKWSTKWRTWSLLCAAPLPNWARVEKDMLQVQNVLTLVQGDLQLAQTRCVAMSPNRSTSVQTDHSRAEIMTKTITKVFGPIAMLKETKKPRASYIRRLGIKIILLAPESPTLPTGFWSCTTPRLKTSG